jgi:hypothetical protein
VNDDEDVGCKFIPAALDVVAAAVAYYHDENCYADFLEAVEAYEESARPVR